MTRHIVVRPEEIPLAVTRSSPSMAVTSWCSEALAKGPYLAETFPVHVEDSYVVVET